MKHELGGLSKKSIREIHILEFPRGHASFVELKGLARDGKDGLFTVMEFVENNLRTHMTFMERSIFTCEVKDLMQQLPVGIKFLHDNGMMHRDLKPSNILVPKKSLLKICDFGLSQLYDYNNEMHTLGVGDYVLLALEMLLELKNYTCAVVNGMHNGRAVRYSKCSPRQALKETNNQRIKDLQQQMTELTSIVQQLVVGKTQQVHAFGLFSSSDHAIYTCPTLQYERGLM
ncbi:cyclin-dependent kinase G-1-like [Andrographis paniculata]|uniref:cyclin-dependent kinase G-1-like n=1 Tax=Andrographis paniculata TaxID=175694 RepID=UPI0021E851B0|nr:cyclin-dependent kinase G-1-like [Andrographis paniculata]